MELNASIQTWFFFADATTKSGLPLFSLRVWISTYMRSNVILHNWKQLFLCMKRALWIDRMPALDNYLNTFSLYVFGYRLPVCVLNFCTVSKKKWKRTEQKKIQRRQRCMELLRIRLKLHSPLDTHFQSHNNRFVVMDDNASDFAVWTPVPKCCYLFLYRIMDCNCNVKCKTINATAAAGPSHNQHTLTYVLQHCKLCTWYTKYIEYEHGKFFYGYNFW